MLINGSKLICVDTSGAYKTKIIQILKNNKRNRIASYADLVIIVIKSYNKLVLKNKDTKQKHRFRKGSMHKGIIIHLKKKIKRKNNTYFNFNQNSIVLTDKRGMPLTKRIKAPVPFEVAKKYPIIASISRFVI